MRENRPHGSEGGVGAIHPDPYPRRGPTGCCTRCAARRRTAPVKSPWHGATFETIRAKFVKVAVRVEERKTRIKLSFPTRWPDAEVLSQITASITATIPARSS